MGEEIEALENHTGLFSNLLNVADICGEPCAVNNDPTIVMLREAINAADQSRLTGT